ncbi:unnamed protein product [Gordionus sp. m RMFG-2023]
MNEQLESVSENSNTLGSRISSLSDHSKQSLLIVTLNLVIPTLVFLLNIIVASIIVSRRLYKQESKFCILLNLSISDALTCIPYYFYYWQWYSNIVRSNLDISKNIQWSPLAEDSNMSFCHDLTRNNESVVNMNFEIWIHEHQDFICRIAHLFWLNLHQVSIFSVCLLNLDMYLALMYPFKHIRTLVSYKCKITAFMCMFIWLCSVALIATGGYLNYSIIVNKCFGFNVYTCFLNFTFLHRVFWYANFVLDYVIPFMWIVYSYARIYRAIKISRNKMGASIRKSRENISSTLNNPSSFRLNKVNENEKDIHMSLRNMKSCEYDDESYCEELCLNDHCIVRRDTEDCDIKNNKGYNYEYENILKIKIQGPENKVRRSRSLGNNINNNIYNVSLRSKGKTGIHFDNKTSRCIHINGDNNQQSNQCNVPIFGEQKNYTNIRKPDSYTNSIHKNTYKNVHPMKCKHMRNKAGVIDRNSYNYKASKESENGVRPLLRNKRYPHLMNEEYLIQNTCTVDGCDKYDTVEMAYKKYKLANRQAIKNLIGSVPIRVPFRNKLLRKIGPRLTRSLNSHNNLKFCKKGYMTSIEELDHYHFERTLFSDKKTGHTFHQSEVQSNDKNLLENNVARKRASNDYTAYEQPMFSSEMKKYIQTSILIIFLFFCCWTPFYLRMGFDLIVDANTLWWLKNDTAFAFFILFLVELNSLFNPIIYCLRTQKFQDILKEIFKNIFRRLFCCYFKLHPMSKDDNFYKQEPL